MECFQWFAAVYTGLVAAAYACLLVNGFVGFQFAEDGTPLSLWVCLMHCMAYRRVSSGLLYSSFG